MGDISLIINVFNVESELSAAALSCFLSLVCTVLLIDCLSVSSLFGFFFLSGTYFSSMEPILSSNNSICNK